jgi:hypothetical protein
MAPKAAANVNRPGNAAAGADDDDAAPPENPFLTCRDGCFNCMAGCMKAFIACILAIRACIRQTFYPCKQVCVRNWDSFVYLIQNGRLPKAPYGMVPSFKIDHASDRLYENSGGYGAV